VTSWCGMTGDANRGRAPTGSVTIVAATAALAIGAEEAHARPVKGGSAGAPCLDGVWNERDQQRTG
jgi:hypothetical protein